MDASHPPPPARLIPVHETLESDSPEQTRRIAAALAEVLEPGDVVALSGDLGAGKTVFVRGVCEALGVPREAGVSSPSYALIHTYDGGAIPLAHLDLYRLGDDEELEAIGFRDLLAGERALLVEWPERAPTVAEVATLSIAFEVLAPARRRLTVTAEDPAWLAPLESLAAPVAR